MVTVIHKVDRCLVVSITMGDRPVPPLNLDLFINHEVTQATDLRVLESPLGCWIFAEVNRTKSYFRRT
jgi:hypothetical protein